MRDPRIDLLAQENIVETGASPGAALGVASLSPSGWRFFTGAAGQLGLRDKTPVGPNTLYDLASVSKPFLALLTAQQIERGLLDWSTRLGSLLMEARGRFAAQASVEELLSHRAGLISHVDLYAPLRERAPVVNARVLELAASAGGGSERNEDGSFASHYSDLGYLLLAAALERALGEPLDQVMEACIATPLNLDIRSARLWFAAGKLPAAFAPTEQLFWRGGELLASVHDENAWALSGHGFAGHAGLFGAIEPLLSFGAQLIDAYQKRSAGWAGSASIHKLTTPKQGGSHALGFDTKAFHGPSSIGPVFGANTFGHLGYTGTSLWCDPDAEIVVGVLSNRVNRGREPNLLRDVRPSVHDRLFELGLSQR